MDGLTLQTLINAFGAPGAFIFYLIWRERQDRNERKERADQDREERKERAEADKSLASSLASLTEVIRGNDR